MKILNNFDNFKFDSIFENENRNTVSELPFVLSDELVDILKNVNHKISTDLLSLNDSREDSKFTFIDVDNKTYSKGEEQDVYFKRFTFVNSNKAYDNMKSYFNSDHESKIKSFLKNYTVDNDIKYMDSYFFNKNRSPVRIGSFIRKVFKDKYKDGGDPGNDIESFVNSIVAYRQTLLDRNKFDNTFELVNGRDIMKWYNEKTYSGEDGTLHSSCMRYDQCGDFIEFYSKNPKKVSMLILHSSEDKIIGRALVWTLDEPVDRIYMDRIYTNNDSDVEKFKQYATKEGWLYKKRQNMKSNEHIVDPTVIEEDGNMQTQYIKMVVNDIIDNEEYPYFDTLCYYNREDGYLTNSISMVESDDIDSFYILNDTDGSYEEIYNGNKIYVEYYDRRINEEDLIYCDYGNEYRLENDAVLLGSIYDNEFATNTYVDDKMVWSSYYESYLIEDDTVYSEYQQGPILSQDSIEVLQDANYDTFMEAYVNNNGEDDIRHTDEIENSVIEYKYKNSTYYFDEKENEELFIQCELYKTNNIVYKHKVWDKNNILPLKSKTYWGVKYTYVTDIKYKDEIIGQTRLFDSRQH